MRRAPLLLLILCLAACDRLGLPDASKTAAAEEADGKAVGAACRHAGRAIEDCYTMNPKAHRAAVFAGWKDMNDYMTQNKIEVVLPVVPRPEPEVKKKKKRPVETESEHAANPSPESGEAAHPEGEKPAKGGHASYGRRGSLDS